MRVGVVFRVLALVSLIVALFMFFPLGVALADGSSDVRPLLLSLLSGLAGSLLLLLLGGLHRDSDYEELGIREALAVVGFAWVIASAVGALPYWMSGVLPRYADAFFETMSGFTTTGATVLTEIEAVPRGILFWRSLTHWLGGMGIIVLSLAVLPFLGVGGMELYKAEVPGPTPEKLTPRVHQTALFLWGVYAFLTVLETVFLMFGGMTFFDALTHSFSTIATGGFSTKNTSVAWFKSSYIEWVITFFMFVSGVNFSLHFLILTGRWRGALHDEELRWYGILAGGASLAIAAFLLAEGVFRQAEPALRSAAFHVVSLMTTTGFVAADYSFWPQFTQFLLLLLMVVGACAGSTGGGCKVVRFLLLGRQIRAEVWRLLHPRAVVCTRVNGKVVSENSLRSVTAFFMLYLAILAGATLAVTAFGNERLDVLSSFSGVIACLSNVGPGLGHLGPVDNFGWLPAGVKWILSFCMLAGRLELFAVVLLFVPGTWSR